MQMFCIASVQHGHCEKCTTPGTAAGRGAGVYESGKKGRGKPLKQISNKKG